MAAMYAPKERVNGDVFIAPPAGRVVIRVNRGEPVEISRLNFTTFKAAEGWRDGVVKTYKALGYRAIGTISGDCVVMVWPGEDDHNISLSVSEVSL